MTHSALVTLSFSGSLFHDAAAGDVPVRSDRDAPGGCRSRRSARAQTACACTRRAAPRTAGQAATGPHVPAGTAGQPTGAGHAARHASTAVTVISPPKVPGRPPSWRTPVLLIAGLTMAVIGGWLFLRTRGGPQQR